MKMTKQDKINLKYHEWCKRICSEAGWQVFGTSVFGGATVFTDEIAGSFDITHRALSLLAKRLGIPDYE